MQEPELHGPPKYYTQDWEEARASVQRLAQLEPELVVTGHGLAMHGPEMRAALHQLATNFDAIALPGRWPLRAASGRHRKWRPRIANLRIEFPWQWPPSSQHEIGMRGSIRTARSAIQCA